MDALKLIPQLFFDLIARVVPGAVALVALNYAINKNILTIAFNDFLPDSALRQSGLVWTLVFFGSAYLTGHFIAPLVRFIEKPQHKLCDPLFRKWTSLDSSPTDSKGGSLLRESILWCVQARYLPFASKSPPRGEAEFSRVQQGTGSNYPVEVREWLKHELDKCSESQYRSTIFVWYDWLRVNYPADAGALTAKIRAEYTMYGGIAVALILALVLNGITVGVKWLIYGETIYLAHPFLLLLAVILVPVMLTRHKDTYGLFQLSVLNFYYVGVVAARAKRQLEPVAPVSTPRSV